MSPSNITLCVSEPPFGGLGSTYIIYPRLNEKRVVDFLVVLIEHFSLTVKAEAENRLKIGVLQGGGNSPPTIFAWIDRPMNRGGTNYGAGSICPLPDFDARGQDYIFALPLFDSFTTYGQLKFVGNQRLFDKYD